VQPLGDSGLDDFADDDGCETHPYEMQFESMFHWSAS
jgi:hypothetical protein